ncbi:MULTISPECIES: hypothetical protein [Microcystis]|jgi:hypothetical protein|uniref:Uncharacterized protein n=3 Tax=Microcystis TaxID=1125 RepID=L7E966_MICAE|nr:MULTISPECIES: hypothetical protein [Microcystis]ELP55208.1 hypothetical protein O53_4038 [Microcystis aeruginosa TAIHU98]ELS50015.1 hypothetical protein C789_150 [Microcystis aeruginosa FACHB-905 = DIANCHI905]MCA2626493.1 hypothetical protein [Microcystis sp. M19BS1]MDB9544437.1 hypothetical protein [Microcystis aeruginosa CS-1036]ODV35731.1 DNA gyrase subunit A [Microcystis aeruginosa NIES-98]
MKKFSPPQMKEVSFPTPHTLHPLSSQETGEKSFPNQVTRRMLTPENENLIPHH